MKLSSLLLASVVLSASASCLADQPNMEAALKSLDQAKESLNKASEDKGGHRVKAIQAIDQAAKEIKAGMEYDRTHTSPDEKKK